MIVVPEVGHLRDRRAAAPVEREGLKILGEDARSDVWPRHDCVAVHINGAMLHVLHKS